MNKKVVTVRIEPKDIAEFTKFCSDVGISVSTAINMFIRNCNINKQFPFSVSSKERAKSGDALTETETNEDRPPLGVMID